MLGGFTEDKTVGPGRVAQLLRAWSQYSKDAGLIPGHGTYKSQPMNA